MIDLEGNFDQEKGSPVVLRVHHVDGQHKADDQHEEYLEESGDVHGC